MAEEQARRVVVRSEPDTVPTALRAQPVKGLALDLEREPVGDLRI
jgi:hypothetical protein